MNKDLASVWTLEPAGVLTASEEFGLCFEPCPLCKCFSNVLGSNAQLRRFAKVFVSVSLLCLGFRLSVHKLIKN